MTQQTNMAATVAADLIQQIATKLLGDAGAGINDLVTLANRVQVDVGNPVSPSPAGQGDARAQFEAWADDNAIDTAKLSDGEYLADDAYHAWLGWQAALAARQPVGEPLWCMHILGPDDVHAAPSKAHAEKAAAALNAFHAARAGQSEHDPMVEAVVAPWPHSVESHAESVADFIPAWMLPRWQVEAIQNNATPPAQQPAQAVHLLYSLDVDPAGIRARVCDVVTGTLMVGAQGHTPPPAGHWTEPFWKAARADATAQAVDLGQFRPAVCALGLYAEKPEDVDEANRLLALIDKAVQP